MKPNLRTFAILGAVGCVLGGILGELLIPRPAPVARETGPTAVVLVIDTSGSMQGGKIEEVKRAAQGFVERQNLSNTSVAVVSFGGYTRIESPLTQNRAALQAAIENLLAGGGTPMDRGLEDGLRALEGGPARRSILLFTDGQPDSERRALRAGQAVREAGVGLVALATGDADVRFLGQLTGSRDLVFPAASGNFDAAFRQAESAIRQLFGGGAGVSVGWALQEAFAWGALVAFGLGLLLLIGLNTLTLRGRWWRDLSWVPVSAGALGGVAAFMGQAFLSGLGTGRGVGWAILGAGAGLFLGLADRSRDKAVRGALGGAAGGLLGGVVFEFLLGLGSGTFARLVGFAILGAAIGLMVQWAQQVFKGAWLVGLSTGPYEGKEYILGKPVVTVGRSDGNDIGLYRERDLPLKAGELRLEGGEWAWNGQTILVNGQGVTRQTLHSGDRLKLGATEFLFRVRGGQPAEAREAWALHGNAQSHPLPFPLTSAVIGSGRGNAVVIAGVAERLAEVRLGEDGLSLTALAPGVQINGQPVNPGQTAALKPGALIRLGAEEFALARRRE